MAEQKPETLNPPMYTDYPLALLETPKHKTGNTDGFTMEASHMCISHNSFIRGLNSIYQQASRLKKSDYPDFITYSLAWHRLVEEHHRYEETGLFLEIDKATGQKGVMSKEVEQHAAFHDGLDAFKAYLVGLKGKEGEFSFSRLIEIMDSFSQPLYTHLSEELDSIVNLSRFSTPDNPIDIVAIALKVGKQAVTRDFALNCLPCFILNMEAVEFEGGMWQEFPPVNAPVRFVLMRVLPLWRRTVWRFASCGENRARKQLAVQMNFRRLDGRKVMDPRSL